MRTAAATPSSVIAPATSRSGMCDVTREVHSEPVMLNSLTKPSTPERVLQVAKLVLVLETAEAHRVLVERREDDAVDLAALCRTGSRLEGDQRRPPAGFRRLARRDGVTGYEIERGQRSASRFETDLAGCAAREVDPGRCDAGTFVQHRAVRVDDHVGSGKELRPREQLDAYFGAYAVGVAEQERETRPPPHTRRCGLSRHGCSPS
jgi:hypothetical protein